MIKANMYSFSWKMFAWAKSKAYDVTDTII